MPEKISVTFHTYSNLRYQFLSLIEVTCVPQPGKLQVNNILFDLPLQAYIR